MADAKADKENYAKALDLDGDGEADGLTAATVDNAVTGTGVPAGVYTDAAASLGNGGTVNVGDASFGDRSESVQDQLIADKQTALNSALSQKVSAAKAGTKALVEAALAELPNVNAALDAKAETDGVLTDKGNEFKAVNATGAGAGDTDYVYKTAPTTTAKDVFVNAAGDKLIAYVDGTTANDVVLATKTGGTWTLSDKGKPTSTPVVKGVQDLLDAYEADQSAAADLAAAKEALEDAVAQVYLNELGGYSVFNPAADINYSNTTAGKFDVTIDFNGSNGVRIFKDKATADADADGVQQVFTFEVTSPGADTKTFKFDGYTYTAGDGTGADDADAETTAENIFNGYSTHATAKWDVELATDGVTLIFTAREAAADVGIAAQLTGDIKGSAGGTLVEDGSGASVNGIAPNVGTGANAAAKAPNAEGINGALADIETFGDKVEAFLEARDLKNDLAGLQEAIDDATDWFADNGYVAPKELENSKTVTGTADDDIFMVDALKGKDTTTINKFGDKGADYLFVGDGFTLVDLGTKVISAKVGDNAAMEIFYKQNGNNLELYIEQESFAGGLTTDGGLTEIVKVTLTGVSFDDITLDGSFITAGA
ncbi:MAG: hypothetical protein RBR77_04040 [Thauera sp.]|nr:hypothetical protein [Thauera sp.]